MVWLGVGGLGTSLCPVKSPLAEGLCPTRKWGWLSQLRSNEELSGGPPSVPRSFFGLHSQSDVGGEEGGSLCCCAHGRGNRFCSHFTETGVLEGLKVCRRKLQTRAEGLRTVLGA